MALGGPQALLQLWERALGLGAWRALTSPAPSAPEKSLPSGWAYPPLGSRDSPGYSQKELRPSW